MASGRAWERHEEERPPKPSGGGQGRGRGRGKPGGGTRGNAKPGKPGGGTPGGGQSRVDSRPSDAMALALRYGADIFAEQSVLESSAQVVVRDKDGADEGEQPDSWKEFLENLDPDAFGKYKM